LSTATSSACWAAVLLAPQGSREAGEEPQRSAGGWLAFPAKPQQSQGLLLGKHRDPANGNCTQRIPQSSTDACLETVPCYTAFPLDLETFPSKK